jgi:hypothetical protein
MAKRNYLRTNKDRCDNILDTRKSASAILALKPSRLF